MHLRVPESRYFDIKSHKNKNIYTQAPSRIRSSFDMYSYTEPKCS